MSVLLWECGSYFYEVVLWDGENTYWIEEMLPSGGYNYIEMDTISPITGGRFTFIGML